MREPLSPPKGERSQTRPKPCRRQLPACPHCGDVHDGRLSAMCWDNQRWTQDERDEWRAHLRRVQPSTVFAPSAAHMQDRFGERNRVDRLADERKPLE